MKSQMLSAHSRHELAVHHPLLHLPPLHHLHMTMDLRLQLRRNRQPQHQHHHNLRPHRRYPNKHQQPRHLDHHRNLQSQYEALHHHNHHTRTRSRSLPGDRGISDRGAPQQSPQQHPGTSSGSTPTPQAVAPPRTMSRTPPPPRSRESGSYVEQLRSSQGQNANDVYVAQLADYSRRIAQYLPAFTYAE